MNADRAMLIGHLYQTEKGAWRCTKDGIVLAPHGRELQCPECGLTVQA